MFKTLIFDLDGTLLDSKKNVSKACLDKLHELQSRGVSLFVASGRHLWEIEKTIDKLELTNNDFVICCDGQYVYNGLKELLVCNPYLTMDDVRFIDSLKKHDILYFYCENQYHRYISEPLLYEELKDKDLSLYKTYNELPSDVDKIEKIRFVTEDIDDDVNDVIRSKYELHILFDKYHDIKNLGQNKYKILEQLSKLYHFNLDECMYFGDDYNDLDCFDNLKYCVAMGNAADTIKKKAFFITKSCDEDGVLYALNNFNKNIGEEIC